MELLWKTSNGENPRGLYRIYFIAHPDEYEKCLEELSSDIFKQASCAVWYKSDPAESIESDILSSFNLIVVGVTRRFLCEENIGRDVELSIVTRSNIPVIPQLQEKGQSRSEK